MICALHVEEFIPYGRQHSAYHPGNVPQQNGLGGLLEGLNEQGITLHKAIKEVRVKDGGKVKTLVGIHILAWMYTQYIYLYVYIYIFIYIVSKL